VREPEEARHWKLTGSRGFEQYSFTSSLLSMALLHASPDVPFDEIP